MNLSDKTFMITEEHYKHLTAKAAHLLAVANNVRYYKQDTKIIFKPVLNDTAILGHTENFAGTRIVIGKDGTYLLGAEHLLLDKHFSPLERELSISIKKLIEGYDQGIRTEYTNLGFINIIPNWWDTIILGTNQNETVTVWQHGKPLSQDNLYLQYDKTNPNMLENIITQIKETNIWQYIIVDETYDLKQTLIAIEKYKYEVVTRFMKQDFAENINDARSISNYKPHMLIIKEIYPIFDVKQYSDEEELTLKFKTLNALNHLVATSNNSGISVLLHTYVPNKASLPQNVRIHFSTIEEIKNVVF